MKTLKNYPIEELKLIYQLLYLHLTGHQSLLESQLLEDLQHYLLIQARQDGVDISNHSAWSQWLTRGV